ncbi:hypothetical protein CcaverHIS631_0402880 [Cutaneotrichosporon cavernicola]|nr:hypothetical protein CcaverHIS631_0402880 [Cutaneotrichosporon cavernicola]
MRLLLLLLFLVCVLAQTQKPLRTSDEFGLSVLDHHSAWCARSGVDNVTIPMPEWYLQTPGGKYFQNMIQSSATAAAVSFGLMAGALALVSLAPLAFL